MAGRQSRSCETRTRGTYDSRPDSEGASLKKKCVNGGFGSDGNASTTHVVNGESAGSASSTDESKSSGDGELHFDD